MNRLSLVVCFVVCGAAVLVVVARRAQSGQADALVRLQQANPGVQQIGHSHINGTARAGQFVGGGAGLTGVNADLLDGFDSTAFPQLSATQTWTGANAFSNASNSFTGNGVGLTLLNASNLSTGTLADARLTGNVALLNAAQTFSAAKTFSTAPSFTAAGAPFSVTSAMLVTNLNADLLDGLNSTAFLQSIPVPLTLSGTNASHIIRAENASTVIGSSAVFGICTSATGQTFGGHFESASTTGSAVFGEATAVTGSTTFGVWGVSASTTGRGVFGEATAASGFTNGVRGVSDSTSGRGVFGHVIAASGTTYGIFGLSTSTSGRGVVGEANANSGATYGGYFESGSTSGRGVFGEATAASGTTYGGHFTSLSTTGVGARGDALSATGETAGGLFQASSTQGVGAYALATATSGITYGLFARTASNGGGYAVYGEAPAATGGSAGVWGYANIAAAGYAVYANGDMGASGVKPFRIDHPLDPENKYLLHYASESPQPQNFYSGNVVTDAKGYVWVELPEYFEEINTDYKYQLTVIGEDFAQAIVSEEIVANRFQIRTNAPRIKVSWRVEANRNDLYVRRKKPKDVVDKEGVEKGTYQHPELYGMPASRGMNYRPDVATPRPEARVSKGVRVARK